jgi:hypothetical protein
MPVNWIPVGYGSQVVCSTDIKGQILLLPEGIPIADPGDL